MPTPGSGDIQRLRSRSAIHLSQGQGDSQQSAATDRKQRDRTIDVHLFGSRESNVCFEDITSCDEHITIIKASPEYIAKYICSRVTPMHTSFRYSEWLQYWRPPNNVAGSHSRSGEPRRETELRMGSVSRGEKLLRWAFSVLQGWLTGV